MRPRFQSGQICKRGEYWCLRYHEDRMVNGAVKRVRTIQHLAPYAEYPFKVNKSNDQVRAAGTLGDMPLSIITATDHGAPPEQEQLWQAWQQQLTSLSTNSMHQIVAGANHGSLLAHQPDARVSAAAILKVVEAARTGQPLAP